MPGEATIGALRVVLGADTAKFEDNLKSAVGSLESFGKKIAAIGAGVGIGIAFEKAFGAVVESITHAIDAADKLQKASQKFGIPTEPLQVFTQAAELSNVSLETLGSSIAKLSKNMIAAEGPTSDQAAAFKALGLSVGDLIKQRPDQSFLVIADALSKYGDSTTKTAAVQAIFGKGAADLLPVLKQLGAGGFDELKKHMQDFGQIVGGQTLQQAEKFKDTLTELGKTKDALILKIIGDSGLLGVMQKLAQTFQEAAGDSKKFDDNFGPLVDLIRGSIRDFENLAAGIDKVKGALPAVNDAAEEGTQRWLEFEFGIKGLEQTMAPIPAVINESANAVAASAKEFVDMAVGLKAVQAAAANFKPELLFSPTANKNLEAFTKQLDKLNASAQDAGGKFSGQVAQGFLQAAAGLKILDGQVQIVDGSFVTLAPQAEQLNAAMLKLQGTQLALSLQDPWPKFQAEIPAMTVALQAAGKSAEDIAALIEKAAERAGVSWKTATSEILANATTAFVGLAQKNTEFAGLAKQLSIAQATFSAYEAFNKALATYPPPFNFIGAGVALAAGLATVAKISATQFAKGGSFMVPGGVNSLDRQLVPLALSAGERVDITPASQAGGGGRAIDINLSGLADDDRFTGKRLRYLFEALNQGQRDGYRLKFAER